MTEKEFIKFLEISLFIYGNIYIHEKFISKNGFKFCKGLIAWDKKNKRWIVE